MSFNLFVLPFSLGLAFLCIYLFVYYRKLISSLPSGEFDKIKRGVFTIKSLQALHEVFMESLLHRKVFKKNKLLGYMHMSFALGWFLLIVMGNVESREFSMAHVNPPYYPIFLKFFMHDTKVLYFEVYTLPGFFRFIMDFLLLFVLSGLILAIIKRFRSAWFGMRSTAKLGFFDKAALYCLWLIFPFRLLAESITAGIYGSGGFLTGSLGDVLALIIPLKPFFMPAWWAYSMVLGVFFVCLPWSRYMHIPTEVILIFLRKYGVKGSELLDAFAELGVKACSRCGICIDVCQMHTYGKNNQTQAVYFLQSLRNGNRDNDMAFNCLFCDRCTNVCPVGIEITSIRQAQRALLNQSSKAGTGYKFIANQPVVKADVLYFAGCMGHLTPSTSRAVANILTKAGISFNFVDTGGSICCGRPLQMAGRYKEAEALADQNKAIFMQSGAHTLVTSCPICLKSFTEKYNLPLRVLHHSQYIEELVTKQLIHIESTDLHAVYHDPCELGRGLGIYDEPRNLISKCCDLKSSVNEKSDAFCCGGSLADFKLSGQEQQQIVNDLVKDLELTNAGSIITACPLCKKTISGQANVPVIDIAELVEKRLV